MDPIKEFEDAVEYFKAATEYVEGKQGISYKNQLAFEYSIDAVTDATATLLSALIRLARAWRALPKGSRAAMFDSIREDNDAVN